MATMEFSQVCWWGKPSPKPCEQYWRYAATSSGIWTFQWVVSYSIQSWWSRVSMWLKMFISMHQRDGSALFYYSRDFVTSSTRPAKASCSPPSWLKSKASSPKGGHWNVSSMGMPMSSNIFRAISWSAADSSAQDWIEMTWDWESIHYLLTMPIILPLFFVCVHLALMHSALH